MRKQIITYEEKQAKKIADILADLRLDLELMAHYIAISVSSVVYNRLQIVSETAKEIKETDYDR